jgi:hypothetical protein
MGKGCFVVEKLVIRLQSGSAADCRGLPRRPNLGKDGRDAERVTTTLTRTQKAELDRLAKAQGVKVAWLVRRAVERFLEESAGGPMLPLDLKGGEDAKR